jgi:hypothetical protein
MQRIVWLIDLILILFDFPQLVFHFQVIRLQLLIFAQHSIEQLMVVVQLSENLIVVLFEFSFDSVTFKMEQVVVLANF